MTATIIHSCECPELLHKGEAGKCDDQQTKLYRQAGGTFAWLCINCCFPGDKEMMN